MTPKSGPKKGIPAPPKVRAAVRRWLAETEDDPDPPAPAEWTLAHWHHLVDAHPDMRYWAAHKVHAPEEIVRRLAAEGDWRVRCRIARKRNLPPDLFPVFAADPDERLRRTIACNQKSPLELVEQLAEDPVESVARVAVYNLRARRAVLDRQRANEESARAAKAKKPSGTAEVEAFLAALDHPLKPEILAVRQIVLGADPAISEAIKWNAPSFRTSEDFATFHLRPRDVVQVILHAGARRKDPTFPGIAIEDPDSLLQWLAKDRATVKLRDLAEIEARRPAFVALLRQWIRQVG